MGSTNVRQPVASSTLNARVLHALSIAPSPPAARCRFHVFTTILVAFLFIFGVPSGELLPSLRDTSVSALSRVHLAHLLRSSSNPATPLPKFDEIYGLLHLVTSDTGEEYSLDRVTNLDSMQPINMTICAAGDKNIN